MRIGLCCNDTRGGVQPYAGVGHALRQMGHEVVLIAPIDFAPLAREAGLQFHGLSGTQQEVAAAAASVTGKGPAAAVALMLKELPRRVSGWATEMLEGAEGCDLLVGGIGGMVTGVPVAQKLGVPFLEAHLQPIGVRSPAMNGLLFGGLPPWVGDFGRVISQRASDQLLWAQFSMAGRLARKAIGVSTANRPHAGLPTLYGFSRHVVPDVGSFGLATGYWEMPAPDWTPPQDLIDFLDTSQPVVVVGFGSMAASDPEAMIGLMDDVSSLAHCRVIYLSGWSRRALTFAKGDVFQVEQVPHSWLFPRVSGIVHHGGAGTTGAALTAGVPQIVVPFGVDQPYWASRVAALGAGPQAIPRRRLNAARLSSAIKDVVGGVYTRPARRLGLVLSYERGAPAAASIISKVAA